MTQQTMGSRFGFFNGEFLWRQTTQPFLAGNNNNWIMMGAKLFFATKVNKSAAKRFRVRGNGSIRRFVANPFDNANGS